MLNAIVSIGDYGNARPVEDPILRRTLHANQRHVTAKEVR